MSSMVQDCCICLRTVSKAQLKGEEDDLLSCAGCGICVHQGCYGVHAVPLRQWHCKKCEPHSLVRASKVRCMFCPSRDGALRQTNGPDETVWCHLVCAQWIPQVKFHPKMDELVDVSDAPTVDNGSCTICMDEGRIEVAATGFKLVCQLPSCSKRFHVTCARKRRLLRSVESQEVFCAAHMEVGSAALALRGARYHGDTQTIDNTVSQNNVDTTGTNLKDGQKTHIDSFMAQEANTAKSSVNGSSVKEKAAKIATTTAPIRPKRESAKDEAKSISAPTMKIVAQLQARAGGRGMIAGVSNAPNLKKDPRSQNLLKLSCKLCNRVYFSHQGMRYHMQHHHGLDEKERQRLDATTDPEEIEKYRQLHLAALPPGSVASGKVNGSKSNKRFKTMTEKQKTSGSESKQSASTSKSNVPSGRATASISEVRSTRLDSTTSSLDDVIRGNGASSSVKGSDVARQSHSRRGTGDSNSGRSVGSMDGRPSQIYRPKHVPKSIRVVDVTRLPPPSRDRKRPYEIVPAPVMERSDRIREPRDVAIAHKKTRILKECETSFRRTISNTGALRCYAEAVDMVPRISETGALMQAEKTAVAGLVKDVAADELTKNGAAVVQRLEVLQQNTCRVVEDIGDMLKLQKNLQSSIAGMEKSIPNILSSLLLVEELEDAVLSDAIHNLESMIILILHALCPVGATSIHPVELDEIMHKIDHAISSYRKNDVDPRTHLRNVLNGTS